MFVFTVRIEYLCKDINLNYILVAIVIFYLLNNLTFFINCFKFLLYGVSTIYNIFLLSSITIFVNPRFMIDLLLINVIFNIYDTTNEFVHHDSISVSDSTFLLF